MTRVLPPQYSFPHAMRGFTLMELVLTVVILAVVAAAVAPVVTTGLRAVVDGRDMAVDEAEATLALERLVREVRRAQSLAGTPEDTRVESITLTLADDNVTYEFADGRLLRDGQVLARRVDTEANDTFFRVDRIPSDEDRERKHHVTMSLRMAASGVSYQATGVPR